MDDKPSRARVKRKWSVDKKQGPLVLASELILKKLRQHSWPAETVVNNDPFDGPAPTFVGYQGRILGPDFDVALQLAVRILNSEHNVNAYLNGRTLALDGAHTVTHAGKLRRVKQTDPIPF